MSALKNIVRLLFVFLLVFGMVGFAVQPASAAGSEDGTAACTQFHTVKRGENLFQIGKLYGVRWQDLAKLNNLSSPYVIYPGQKLCVSTQGTVTPPSQPPAGTIPTFSIASVVADSTVTISTKNFPANDNFDVLMGRMGTRGVNGIKVATFASGAGGTLSATFNIPDALKGLRQIAIRLQSNTGSGYFAYNWFYNNTTGSGTGGGDGTGGPSYTGFPTFSIASVVRNQSVTIVTKNLPPNDSFNVRMGPMGTRGVNGYLVTTINSGSGGTQTLTFNIPSQLSGASRIAIRMESPTSGYFAYNWFYNNNA